MAPGGTSSGVRKRKKRAIYMDGKLGIFRDLQFLQLLKGPQKEKAEHTGRIELPKKGALALRSRVGKASGATGRRAAKAMTRYRVDTRRESEILSQSRPARGRPVLQATARCLSSPSITARYCAHGPTNVLPVARCSCPASRERVAKFFASKVHPPNVLIGLF